MNVLNGISADQLYDYNTLLSALEARFGNGQLHQVKLKNRVRKREGRGGEIGEGAGGGFSLPTLKTEGPLTIILCILLIQ